MIAREIVLSPEASRHLLLLYDWIADQASPDIALAYIERLEGYVRAFDLASERGTLRNDIRQGLRTVGFERRVTIAFEVTEKQVTILGFYSGGQDWRETLAER